MVLSPVALKFWCAAESPEGLVKVWISDAIGLGGGRCTGAKICISNISPRLILVLLFQEPHFQNCSFTPSFSISQTMS